MSDLTKEELASKAAALSHPLFVPDAFKGYLEDFAARVATDFYIQQGLGFREDRFVSAEPKPNADSCPNTTTWGDLSTSVGPEINHLSDGFYIFIFGFNVAEPRVSSYHSAIIEVNHVAPSPPFVDEEEYEVEADRGNAFGFAQFRLDNNNDNYVKMIYKVGTAGDSFERRFLHAVKVRQL